MSGGDFRGLIADLGKRSGLAGSQRTVAAVAIFLCGLAVLFAALRWWPDTENQGFSIESGAESGATADQAAGEAGDVGRALAAEQVSETTIVVHVAGAVRRPGVIRCPPGSRVADAVSAAGGLLGNAAGHAINLARVLVDGEQVYVPTLDEVAAGAGPSLSPGGGSGGGPAPPGSTQGATSGLIDLNAATVEQLDTLPGIGPVTAAKIVSDREANGLFAAPEDLMRVSGIGQKKFAALKDLVTVR